MGSAAQLGLLSNLKELYLIICCAFMNNSTCEPECGLYYVGHSDILRLWGCCLCTSLCVQLPEISPKKYPQIILAKTLDSGNSSWYQDFCDITRKAKARLAHAFSGLPCSPRKPDTREAHTHITQNSDPEIRVVSLMCVQLQT